MAGGAVGGGCVGGVVGAGAAVGEDDDAATAEAGAVAGVDRAGGTTAGEGAGWAGAGGGVSDAADGGRVPIEPRNATCGWVTGTGAVVVVGPSTTGGNGAGAARSAWPGAVENAANAITPTQTAVMVAVTAISVLVLDGAAMTLILTR